MEITLNEQNFESEVMQSDKTVLIDFWASWCGPCKMIAPIVSEIATEYSDTVKVCKVNVDDEPSLANAFNISAIPTLAVIKNGKVTEMAVGFKTKEDIIKML